MSNYEYRYAVKVAIDLTIRDCDVSEEYRIKEGIVPYQASQIIEDLGWEFSDRTGGSDSWVYDDYINSNYPNIVLTMSWNGWTGNIDFYAGKIDE